MKKLLILFLVIILVGCNSGIRKLNREDDFSPEIDVILNNMTLEEKIAQMFIINPEDLVSNTNPITNSSKQLEEAFEQFPVGGIIYMGSNLNTPSQTTQLLSDFAYYSLETTGLPLFQGVDEEGGTVARIANNDNFEVNKVGNMSDVKSEEEAYEIGFTIGEYLSELGFNLDFAPDTDVLTNSENTVVKYRSFSSDGSIVASYASSYLSGLSDNNIIGTYKHFPGHGSTVGDSHLGYAYSELTLDELMANDLIPFIDAIDTAEVIMVGHISFPNILDDSTPASLSSYFVTELLIKQLGYTGLIVTDALDMGAISQNYSSGEAVIAAVNAGNDLLLMPTDFITAYNQLLDAVENKEISEERIDYSLRKIIRLKLQLNN